MDVLERILQNIRSHLNSLNLPNSKSFDSITKSITKIKVRPFTRENVLYYYIPMQGLVSYTTLSVSVMNPHLMVRLFPKRDITNILLLSAGGGAALWLYSRPHMVAASPSRRFSWAFLGATVWSLGSILLWAILRSSIGKKPFIGTVLGITTGGVLTHTALDYFHYIELMFCGDIRIPEETAYPSSEIDEDKYDIDI